MIRHLGYACINETLKPLSYKSIRLKTIENKGIEVLKEVMLHNLNHLEHVLRWNLEHNIFFYRIGSDVFPLITHHFIRDQYTWENDEVILKRLAEIKVIVVENKLRISMHPDQFNVLNSLNEKVVQSTIETLSYHVNLLELIGGKDMILHVGGVYGDKKAAIARFIKNYNELDEKTKSYFRLENDDKSYTIHDVIEISKVCSIPIIFDYHHHRCHQDHELTPMDIRLIYDSWDYIPKFHLSSGRSHSKDRSHADYIDKKDIEAIEALFDFEFDLMLETKKKDLTILRLRSQYET
jgi:UV DNA damage endonuclease